MGKKKKKYKRVIDFSLETTQTKIGQGSNILYIPGEQDVNLAFYTEQTYVP